MTLPVTDSTPQSDSLVLPFGFCWLGGLMGSTLPPADDPELLPLLPMTPTPLPGAKPPPTGLNDMSEEDPPPTPRPRIPAPGAEEPSRPPEEDVGAPTVTPPRETGRLQPMALEAAAWA